MTHRVGSQRLRASTSYLVLLLSLLGIDPSLAASQELQSDEDALFGAP
jgi:hypothetical protein